MPVGLDLLSGNRGGNGPVAVIDIGSNSLRLVVYDRIDPAPIPLFNEKVLCGLGRGLSTTGRLNPDGVVLALATLRRFVALARSIGVVRLDVIATAAVRDAADSREFTAQVETSCGIRVAVLDGESEGRLSALGVLAGIPDADGLMGDMGGGSVELVPIAAGRPGPSVSLPIGPLRLAEWSGNERRLREIVDQHIASVPGLDWARGRSLYLVGGAWRALARIHMEHANYPLHVIQQYTVNRLDAEDFLQLVGSQSRKSLEKVIGVPKKRLETVPLSAYVLGRLVRYVGPRQLVFSAEGLREGFIRSLLPPSEQARDPLLVACERMAAGYRRFGAHGRELFDWCSPLLPNQDSERRRLSLAAALISDIAWNEHPDYRAEQAYMRVLRMPVGGIDHAGRVFVATALHARYGGSADAAARHGPSRLLSEDATAEARTLGLALRLGYTLSGGAPGIVARTSLDMVDRELVVTVPEDLAPLVGESVQRRLDALSRQLGCRGTVTVAAPPPPASSPLRAEARRA
jgi:exopolyphosphatase/guanosine-5'-triphosphate,3'-diphosphate pyrophosphatase